jgi:hypothetical protein
MREALAQYNPMLEEEVNRGRGRGQHNGGRVSNAGVNGG